MATSTDLSATESLWKKAGGKPALAHLMAAIADAESSLNPRADMPDPAPGDPSAHSVGLWQINSPNFAALGLTTTTAMDPLLNARGAVALAGNTPAGLANWTTYREYKAWLQGRGPETAAAKTIAADLKTVGVDQSGTTWDDAFAGSGGVPGAVAGAIKTTAPIREGGDLLAQLRAWWAARSTPEAGLVYAAALGCLVLVFVLFFAGFGAPSITVSAAPGKATA